MINSNFSLPVFPLFFQRLLWGGLCTLEMRGGKTEAKLRDNDDTVRNTEEQIVINKAENHSITELINANDKIITSHD